MLVMNIQAQILPGAGGYFKTIKKIKDKIPLYP